MFALITGAVLIGVATTIVDIAAVNLYWLDKNRRPYLTATSRVIRAKRVEHVKPNAVMAAQGMTAALAVGCTRPAAQLHLPLQPPPVQPTALTT